LKKFIEDEDLFLKNYDNLPLQINKLHNFLTLQKFCKYFSVKNFSRFLIDSKNIEIPVDENQLRKNLWKKYFKLFTFKLEIDSNFNLEYLEDKNKIIQYFREFNKILNSEFKYKIIESYRENTFFLE